MGWQLLAMLDARFYAAADVVIEDRPEYRALEACGSKTSNLDQILDRR